MIYEYIAWLFFTDRISSDNCKQMGTTTDTAGQLSLEISDKSWNLFLTNHDMHINKSRHMPSANTEANLVYKTFPV